MNVNLEWLFCVAAGAGIGALAGHFNRCRTGACPLLANWRRGTLYGAVIVLVFFSVAGCGGSAAMNESTANVQRITDAEFEAEVTQATLPVVVDFYATWCGPCRRQAPIMDALAGQYAGKIRFVKVNVDESPKLAQAFQVAGIPMLMFFKNGKPTEKLVGLQAKKALIRQLDSLLQTNSPSAPPGQ